MKHTERYNGWRNYETWNVALWLGNDEGLYNAARAAVQAHRGRITADVAAGIVTELLPNGTPDMKDMHRVHWPEIARMFSEKGGGYR